MHDSLPLTNGFAIIGGNLPEPVVLSAVSAPSGGVQTFSVISSRPHEIGSYIFQGGTQGINVFADDQLKAGDITEIIVLGAADSSHEIIQIRGNSSNSLNVPWAGSMAETTSSAFAVHPAGLIYTLAQDGVTETLSANTAGWAANDEVYSPPPTAYVENIYGAVSTQLSPANPSNGGSGYVLVNHGNGFNNFHPAFAFLNLAPSSHYISHGGWLSPPPLLSTPWDDAVVGPWIKANSPEGPDAVCSDNPTYFCDVNRLNVTTGFVNLYENNGIAHSQISFDRTNQIWQTFLPWRSIKGLQVGDGISGVNQDSLLMQFPFITPGFGAANGITWKFMPLGNGIAHISYNVDSFAPTFCQYFTTDASNAMPLKLCSNGTGGGLMSHFLGAIDLNGVPILPTIPVTLTTTAATTEVITVTGMTASGHCSLGALNSAAATNITTTFISSKATNSVTVTHAATAGMVYDLLCTPN